MGDLTDNTDKNMTDDKQLKFIYLNLTNHCNLRCLYCYDEDSRSKEVGSPLPLSTYENLANDCKKLGLEEVCLTGGEAFINKNWREIAKIFRNLDIRVTISTNGTIINEQIALTMKELNIEAQISLDGDEEMMSFISRRDFAYRRALNGIELLVKNGIPMNLNSVISRKNFHMMDLLSEISVKFDIGIRFTLYNDIFNSSNGQLQALSIEEVAQFIKKVEQLYETNPRIFTALPPLLVPAKMKPGVNPGCGWAYHVGGVLFNGDVTICALASGCPELIAGNIQQQSFYDIWTNSPVLTKLRSYSYTDLKGFCANCPVTDLCIGACRLDSYIRFKDQTASFNLCQAYYEAILKGLIPEKEFPSKALEVC